MVSDNDGPYNDLVYSHYSQPRNLGQLADATHKSRLMRGDTMLEFYLHVADGRILAATYRVIGCAATVAAGSVLTEWLIDRPLTEAARLDSAQLLAVLGGLPVDRHYAADFAAEAVRMAVESPREALSD